MSTHQPLSFSPQAPRTDAAPIDLRIQAEEQVGGEGGEDPSLGGGRQRRRLAGGRRRDADILEARIDALADPMRHMYR